MAGVCVGDGVAEGALNPGQGGVSEPVGGDSLLSDPGKVASDAAPEGVVAATCDGTAGAVSEGWLGAWCAVLGSFGDVLLQGEHERGGHGLPTHGATFLPESDTAVVVIEVLDPETEGSTASAGGFDVESQEEKVELGVVACRRCGVDDLCELALSEGAAGTGQSPRASALSGEGR